MRKGEGERLRASWEVGGKEGMTALQNEYDSI